MLFFYKRMQIEKVFQVSSYHRLGIQVYQMVLAEISVVLHDALINYHTSLSKSLLPSSLKDVLYKPFKRSSVHFLDSAVGIAPIPDLIDKKECGKIETC